MSGWSRSISLSNIVCRRSILTRLSFPALTRRAVPALSRGQLPASTVLYKSFTSTGCWKEQSSASDMSKFQPDTSAFSTLKGNVVVLTGGSTGIGRATTRTLIKHGAHVVFGDTNTEAGTALADELSSSAGQITFVPCNVTDYNDIYTLFHTAHSQHGAIDHAISSAGIFETGAWFDGNLTIDTVQAAGAGPTAVIDVNVLGSANFSRVAVAFMRAHASPNRSLTLLSSVNAFRESPGLYMYQTSKHAIQGLMRAMRKPIFERDGIRVNCVCPGVTESEMTRGIIDTFKEQGLYWQPAEAVAEIIVGMVVDGDMHGKAVYVEGSEGWEFEESFYREQPRWLGEEATRRMRVNAEAVNKGALTKK